MSEDKKENKPGEKQRTFQRFLMLFSHIVTISHVVHATSYVIATVMLGISIYSGISVYTSLISKNIDELAGKTLILQYGIIVTAFAVVFGLVLVLRYQSLYARERSSSGQIVTMNSALSFRINQYSENNEDFLLIAYHNADCDKKLFDVFMNQIVSQQGIPPEAITRALAIIEANLDMILDHTKTIFGRTTGHKCAICIKIIDYDSEHIEIPRDLRIRTLNRDSYSRNSSRIQHDHRYYSVRSNTADRHIFTSVDGHYPNDIYADDDLIKARKEGRYENERSDWDEDYTATLVCGIRNLRVGEKIPWIGEICIDNKGGGLNNEVARHNIIEVAYRLSVMLYRQSLLEEMQSVRRSS